MSHGTSHSYSRTISLAKLLRYDFTIKYKPGTENLAANALSRSCFKAFSQLKWDLITNVCDAVASDSTLFDIIRLCNAKTPNPHYSIHNQLLFWKHRLVVLAQHPLIKTILQEFHSYPIGGHSGIARTVAWGFFLVLLARYAPYIKSYVQQCLICQKAKSSTTSPTGLLQPLPILHQWEDLAMDFIVGLPPSYGFFVIMVVIDRLSKYAHFCMLKADYSSKLLSVHDPL